MQFPATYTLLLVMCVQPEPADLMSVSDIKLWIAYVESLTNSNLKQCCWKCLSDLSTAQLVMYRRCLMNRTFLALNVCLKLSLFVKRQDLYSQSKRQDLIRPFSSVEIFRNLWLIYNVHRPYPGEKTFFFKNTLRTFHVNVTFTQFYLLYKCFENPKVRNEDESHKDEVQIHHLKVTLCGNRPMFSIFLPTKGPMRHILELPVFTYVSGALFNSSLKFGYQVIDLHIVTQTFEWDKFALTEVKRTKKNHLLQQNQFHKMSYKIFILTVEKYKMVEIKCSKTFIGTAKLLDGPGLLSPVKFFGINQTHISCETFQCIIVLTEQSTGQGMSDVSLFFSCF